MDKIRTEYCVNLSDFRKATYYGLYLRHRKALIVLFAVLTVGLFVAAGGTEALSKMNPLIVSLAAAYLIWGIFLFAGAERGIRQYIKMPGSLIGCTYVMTLESHRIRIEIPERKINVNFQTGQLANVFELEKLFLIYVDAQQVYLLPHRALTGEQILAIRKNFRERLGKRFSSKAGRKK